MQILGREGVKYVFGLPGSTELLFMDALEDHPEINYILGLHESIVVGMAEGYAIASNNVGVASLHTSPGLASSMGALINAYGAQAPLLVLVGQQDARLLMGEPCLTADLKELASPLVKWGTEVSQVNDIPLALRRGFKTAQDIPKGPVMVSLPKNLMAESLELDYQPHIPYNAKLRPDLEEVHRAVEALESAQSPMVIVGSGVAKHDAVSEVVELAESIGAPVYQTWTTDMNFPTSHPQYIGDLMLMNPKDQEKLKSTDVLVSIGNPVFRLVNLPDNPLLAPEAKIIQIDSDVWEIGKNMPVYAGILGDIKVSVAEINHLLQTKLSAPAREAAEARAENIAADKRAIKEALYEKALAEKDNVPISASWAMHVLGKCLEPETILVNDCWSNIAVVNNHINFDEPGSYLRLREYRHGGGSIGWGMPVSLGVKLACPERPVVAVVGDGSAIFYCQALWTAAHYNIPVVFVLLANAGYSTLKKVKIGDLGEKARGRYLGLNISEPQINFSTLAESLGIRGKRVENPEALEEAFKSVIKEKKPALVEVILDDKV
jgi:benzoylformate decarboxylase